MVENLQPTFDRILRNNEAIAGRSVGSLLVLYDEDIRYLGDSCRRFDLLRHFRGRFNSGNIHMNFRPGKNHKYYDGLLKNNPHIDRILSLDWKDIDLRQYDVIFCISYQEPVFLQFLEESYGDAIRSGVWELAVFSVSQTILAEKPDAEYIFPENKALMELTSKPGPGELYISNDERDWADDWLRRKGVEKDEELFICCDSASERFKLMDIVVYFEFLEFLLGKCPGKVLVFDEKSIGKADIYRAWLGDRAMDKLIFSEGLSLREDLCIIGSRHTRLIFGPCTGLMHCASSIYNHFVRNGMPASEAPLIITYTGQYALSDQNAKFWWDNSPLVKCLLLRKIEGRTQLRLLSAMPPEEKDLFDSLPCTEYTAEMLTDFVNAHYRMKAGSSGALIF